MTTNGKRKESSEGVRRLSLAVGIVATAASLLIIGANVIPHADSALVLFPLLIVSGLIGVGSFGLVRLVAWTAAGFRANSVARAGGMTMSKYDPVYKYFSAQNEPTVTMTSAEIEAILGSRKYPAWWANADPKTGQHPYSQAWILADMRAIVNLTAERVVFERLD